MERAGQFRNALFEIRVEARELGRSLFELREGSPKFGAVDGLFAAHGGRCSFVGGDALVRDKGR